MPKRSKKERKKEKRREKLRRREEAGYRRQLRAQQGFLNPYSHEPDQDAKIADDFAIMRAAWKEHFGEIEDEFTPPFGIADHDGSPHQWVFAFKRLMIEKYGSIWRAAPRVKFMLTLLVNSPAYDDDEDRPPSIANPYGQDPDPQASLDADLLLMEQACREFFPDEDETFVPDFTDGKGGFHVWIDGYRQRMRQKYEGEDVAEARLGYTLIIAMSNAFEEEER